MLLNLSDVFREQGKVIRESVPVELASFDTRMGRYPVMEKSELELTVSNLEPGRAKIEGKAVLVFKAPCDRCLQEVPVVLELKIERFTASPEKATEENEGEDDLSFMEGYFLNTETLLHSEIMENWPAKILCKEDCKGICIVCGRNLNDGDCGCDRFVPDPRMAAISDVFNRGKEV